MGLLDGKRIVITGVLTDASIAFGVARLAQEQGAEIVLTGAGRGLSLTERTARKLPSPPPVLELDVTEPDHLVSVRDDLAERWGRVDGVLHAIGFAPAVCLGGTFMEATWDDVSVALHVSTYSLKALVDAFGPLMGPGSALVGLDFDATRRLARLRLDGRRQGRAGVDLPLPGPRAGVPRHPGQPGGRRSPADDGRQVDPRLLGLRGLLAGPRSARLGHHRHRAGRRGPASPCSPTGSRPRRARWSTWTAATTPSAPEAAGRSAAVGPGALARASSSAPPLSRHAKCDDNAPSMARFRHSSRLAPPIESTSIGRCRRRPAAQPTIDVLPDQYGARRSRFRIFPEPVFGSSSMKATERGIL